MILPPSFFALENELIALGRKQRSLQRQSERLGFFCRARELEGASPQRAQADYRRFQHKGTVINIIPELGDTWEYLP